MEADFPLNDMLLIETGLTEEAPSQLVFGKAVLFWLRGMVKLDGWIKEGSKENVINLRP